MASAFYSTQTMPHAFVEPVPSSPGSFAFPQSSPLTLNTGVPYGFNTSPFSTPAAHRRKRKHSDAESDESDSRDAQSPRSTSPTPLADTPRHKRRRLTPIERGMNNLSLDRMSFGQPPALAVMEVEPVVEEPDDLARNSYSYYGDVDEPYDEPTLKEVKMHNSSWYEPEKDRIVITDLDGSDDELEEPSAPSEQSYTVSLAAMAAIRRSRAHAFSMPHRPTGPDAASALVLYRPAPWDRRLDEPQIEVLEMDDPAIALPQDMDVDMMDVEEL